MATKNAAKAAAPPPPTSTVEGVEGAAPDSPLAKFSRELGDRFPNTMVRRYLMPTSVRECREVFMREITSRDEVEAAIMADALMSPIEKASVRLSGDAERRECIRLSVVGLGKLSDKSNPASAIAYEHVNQDGAPFGDINEWSGRAWTALQTYFGTLNGVPMEELAEGLAGAQTVGAFAPPTSATRASAANGR